ncbi:MAG: hypothetical protein U0165_01985 [Polyangiaceae bacterium]
MTSRASSRSLRAGLLLVALAASQTFVACQPYYGPITVSVRMKPTQRAPGDALVSVDDVVIGNLALVSRRGLAVQPGLHRVTVERAGYFPWDRAIDATEAPVMLDVDMVPIPE